MSATSKSSEMEVDDTSVTICRLCAEMTSSKSFIPLFTDDKQEQNVAKQVNQLVHNLVSPNDGLPQEVCLNCAENVGKFYLFVSNIIETQNKLRRIMQLPELKKMDSNDDHQISFINADNTSQNALTLADIGPQIDVHKDSNIRLNGKTNISAIKETLQEKLRGNALNDRVVMPNDVTVISGSQNPHVQQSTANRTDQYTKLFRCTKCSAKFKTKSECLRHIVQYHSETKKQVTPNTIFELVSKPTNEIGNKSLGKEDFNKQNNVDTNTQNADHSYNLGQKKTISTSTLSTLPTARPTVKTPATPTVKTPATNTSQTKTASTRTTNATNTSENKPKPGPRHRKVLAIDGFFKEVQKRVTRYICDVCGRAMASQFAFARHLREHDWSDEEEEKEKEEKEKVKQKEERVRVPRPLMGYCESCELRVSNIVRHKMYHQINKLEKDYPEVVKLINFS